MTENLDRENEDLQNQFEHREPGVAELLQLYARVEPVYVAAAKALEERRSIMASNTTNRR